MVERAAECSVCCALMSEPKLLGCAHTYVSFFNFLRLFTEVRYGSLTLLPNCSRFCKTCISSLSDGATSVKCPECRVVTALHKRVDGLATNFALASVVEALRQVHGHSVVCGGCAKGPVAWTCAKCDVLLCAECGSTHGQVRIFSLK